MDRLQANKLILKLIASTIKKHPELRFIQLLWCLNIVDGEDRFYEESEDTLEKVLKTYESEGYKTSNKKSKEKENRS